MSAIASIDFDVTGVQDPVVKDILQRIRDYFREHVLVGAQIGSFEHTFTKAVDKLKIPHGFNFQPTDIIQTAIIGTSNIIWELDLFDATNLVVTASSPCTVRALFARLSFGG